MNKKKLIEIIEYIKNNNLFTNSKIHDKVYKKFKENNEKIKFILTSGEPKGTDECRECHKILSTSRFSYYQARVKQDGYLGRSNALCEDCSKKSMINRNKILEKDKNKIPKKPKKGDICKRCGRKWKGKWHRDHDEKTKEFNIWLCGNCNMSKGDQRNPHINRI